MAACSNCRDIGWLLTDERDRDNMPMTTACLECPKGIESWRQSVGLKVGERIPTFDDFDPRRQPGVEDRRKADLAWSCAMGWALDEMQCLVLSGPVGVGKSHLAKAALWHAAGRGIRGMYLTMAAFDHQVKDFEARPWVQERRRQALFTVSRLVIDDLGSGNREGSAFVQEKLAEMFDERYRTGLNTLVTTNLTEQDFASAIGVRSWDRVSEHGRFAYMPGESMRRSIRG